MLNNVMPTDNFSCSWQVPGYKCAERPDARNSNKNAKIFSKAQNAEMLLSLSSVVQLNAMNANNNGDDQFRVRHSKNGLARISMWENCDENIKACQADQH